MQALLEVSAGLGGLELSVLLGCLPPASYLPGGPYHTWEVDCKVYAPFPTHNTGTGMVPLI